MEPHEAKWRAENALPKSSEITFWKVDTSTFASPAADEERLFELSTTYSTPQQFSRLSMIKSFALQDGRVCCIMCIHVHSKVMRDEAAENRANLLLLRRLACTVARDIIHQLSDIASSEKGRVKPARRHVKMNANNATLCVAHSIWARIRARNPDLAGWCAGVTASKPERHDVSVGCFLKKGSNGRQTHVQCFTRCDCVCFQFAVSQTTHFPVDTQETTHVISTVSKVQNMSPLVCKGKE